MARRRRSSLALSGEQAQAALALLIQEGKLRASEVKKALQRRDRLIRVLRASLAALESGVGTIGKRLKGSLSVVRRVGATKRKPARRKAKRVSPARRRAMQQQGQYLGAIRQLRPADRAKVKKVRAEKGFAAAIAEARRLARAS